MNAPGASRKGALVTGSPLAQLLNASVRAGVVAWIGLRTARQQPLLPVSEADLDPLDGLVGDHFQSRRNQLRQVTLVQAEHLAAIASYLGVGQIDPARLRRNIVVSGLNLLALAGRQFRLGSAVLLATGACHPCSRMEEALGAGGYNAVRGHGGITARVLTAGKICVGDAISRIDDDPPV
jgi:MOSC domain-containing protein YiiM